MTGNGLLDTVMRDLGKEVARDVLRSLVFDTLIEAQFIQLFSGYYLKRQLREVAIDSINEIIMNEEARKMEENVLFQLVPLIA